MALPRRTLLIVLGSIVALVLLIGLCIPLFLNADSFRARIETALTTSLGRKVTLGKLDLSVLTGNLVAENATLADDPAFSTQPFLQASRVKIGVEIFPLIFSREIHITGFAIEAPKITLLRAANGTWNYSTIGRAQQNTAATQRIQQPHPQPHRRPRHHHRRPTHGWHSARSRRTRLSAPHLRQAHPRRERLLLPEILPLHRLSPPPRRRHRLAQRQRRPHQST